jgi:hypothetical protein
MSARLIYLFIFTADTISLESDFPKQELFYLIIITPCLKNTEGYWEIAYCQGYVLSCFRLVCSATENIVLMSSKAKAISIQYGSGNFTAVHT